MQTGRKFGGESQAEAMAMQAATESTALVWYIDPANKWPVWLQYCYLWCKRTIFRRPLE